MNKLIRDGEEMEKPEKPEITLEEQTVTGIFLTPAPYIFVSFIPFLLMYRTGKPLEYYGFSDKDILLQINTGILSGLILSCIIIVPHFLIGEQKEFRLRNIYISGSMQLIL